MSNTTDAREDIAAPAQGQRLVEAVRRFIGDPFFWKADADPRVWWNPGRLIAVSVLMAWGHGSQALGERFEAARSALPEAGGRAGSYQGYLKAMGRWADEAVIDLAGHELVRAMRAMAGPHARRFGWVALAVDGSRFDVPRTAANEAGIGLGGKKKSPPQPWLTTLWHMGLGLPWTRRVGRADASERGHLGAMLGQLPARALVVADAGYTGYGLLKRITDGGRSFLIRLGSGTELVRDLGYAEWEDGRTVCLWPDRQRRHGHPPLVLRLIRVEPAEPGGEAVCLLTDVRDAAALYRMRWGVEVFFRSMKQTFGRRELLSRAPRQVYLELHGAVLGMALLGLMSVEAILGRGGDPLRLSVAAALRAVRRAMRQPRRILRNLKDRLAGAVKDAYVRHRPRAARDWPHKKKQKPPGKPTVRHATPTQRAHAARLAACQT